MTRKTNLPSIPPVQADTPAMSRWIAAVVERLEILSGSRGEPNDQALTKHDLIDITRKIETLPKAKTIEQFATELKGMRLYQDLVSRIDNWQDAAIPQAVKQLLSSSITEEAKKRGAAISTLESKMQNKTDSLAYKVEEVTAAMDDAAAGVRELTFASANAGAATSGRLTTVEAVVNDTDITAHLDATVHATLAALKLAVGSPNPALYYQVANPIALQDPLLFKYDAALGWTIAGKGIKASVVQSMRATADRNAGAEAQYTLKVTAGGRVAGFGLSAIDSATPESAFLIQADKFALVGSAYAGGLTTSPASTLVPFGVDAATNTVYINGSVRINATGSTLDSITEPTGIRISYSSSFFKINAAGAAVNTDIQLTAVLNGTIATATDNVTWSHTGTSTAPPAAAPTYPTPNVYTVNAADQTADSETYTATIVVGGDTYSNSVTLLRLRDGTVGTRGTRQLYLTNVAYVSSYPSYAAAATSAIATATTGTYPTTPIVGDTVTFTDGSAYSTTRTCTVAGVSPTWSLPGVVIDGSLLVTGSITGTALAANTVTASKINTNGLDIKTPGGVSIFSSVIPLTSSYITPASGWLNSNVTVNANGTLSGAGAGAVTPVGIGAIKTDASNAPSTVMNSSITLSSGGVLSGAGGGAVTAGGINALSSNSQNILAGAGGVASGTVSWDAAGNVSASGTGVAITAKGLVGVNAGATTFALNATTGAASFGGTLSVGPSPGVSGTTMTGSGAVINSNGTFALGTSSNNITYNGSTITINGALVLPGNISATNLSDIRPNLGTITGGSLNIGSGVFTVSAAGSMVATSATITGAVTATSGAFTGTVNANAGTFTGGVTIGPGGVIKSGQTAYNTGAGFWLSGGTTPQFSIGSGTSSITWSGTRFDINGACYINNVLATTVTAGAADGTTANNALPSKLNNSATDTLNGTISFGSSGAFKIGTVVWTPPASAGLTGSATGSGMLYNQKGIVGVSSGVITFVLDAVNGNAIFKGDITGASGTFSGTISGATVTGNTISGGTISGTTISGGSLSIGANFGVNSTGNLTATNATISGAITATSGSFTGAITANSGLIGSFTIGTYLYTGSKLAYNTAAIGVHIGSDGIGLGNGGFTVDPNGQMWVGNTAYASAPFKVSAAGALTATGVTITGAITATSGSFTGSITGGTTLAITGTATFNGVTSGTNTTAILANSSSTAQTGVEGRSSTAFKSGIYGKNSAANGFGVAGVSQNSNGIGVIGAGGVGGGSLILAAPAGGIGVYGAAASGGYGLYSDGTLYVNGTSSLVGNTAVTGTLSSSGLLTASGGLTVTGSSSHSAASTFASTVGVSGLLSAIGGLAVTGSSAHSGAATFSTTVGVTGALTASGGLVVTGTSSHSGAATFASTVAVTGAFGCNGKPAQGSFAVGAASTDLASVIALCNNLRAILVANGIAV